MNILFGIFMMKTKTAVFYAILAAVLYVLMAPVSKLLQVSVPPVAEAGLLYLGAGTGMSLIYLFRKKYPSNHPSVDKNDLKYLTIVYDPNWAIGGSELLDVNKISKMIKRIKIYIKNV